MSIKKIEIKEPNPIPLELFNLKSLHFEKWNLSLMKQFIIYMSLCKTEGETLISEEELALTLGYSTRTIKNNADKLTKMGLIEYRKLLSDYVFVSLTNQNLSITLGCESVLPNSPIKMISVQISSKLIGQLLNINNFNTLKIALYTIYAYKLHKVKNNSDEFFLSLHDLKSFLKHQTKSTIRLSLEDLKNIYEIEIVEGASILYRLLTGNKTYDKTKLKDGFVVFIKPKNIMYK
ncbi:hypothetical protein COK10_19865 [Bacillus anthracis]|nr:hypothetical protein COK10_19865 [Bacillus anthracis]